MSDKKRHILAVTAWVDEMPEDHADKLEKLKEAIEEDNVEIGDVKNCEM